MEKSQFLDNNTQSYPRSLKEAFGHHTGSEFKDSGFEVTKKDSLIAGVFAVLLVLLIIGQILC